jgi:hypothetical protein
MALPLSHLALHVQTGQHRSAPCSRALAAGDVRGQGTHPPTNCEKLSGKSCFLSPSPLLSLSPSVLLVRQGDSRCHTGLSPVRGSRVTLAGCIFN